VFLVLPGFLSDIVALALLLPPVRGWIYGSLAGRVSVVSTTGWSSRSGARLSGRIDEPGVIELDDDDYRSR
jgi:UPF0716 protein FxsA